MKCTQIPSHFKLTSLPPRFPTCHYYIITQQESRRAKFCHERTVIRARRRQRLLAMSSMFLSILLCFLTPSSSPISVLPSPIYALHPCYLSLMTRNIPERRWSNMTSPIPEDVNVQPWMLHRHRLDLRNKFIADQVVILQYISDLLLIPVQLRLPFHSDFVLPTSPTWNAERKWDTIHMTRPFSYHHWW